MVRIITMAAVFVLLLAAAIDSMTTKRAPDGAMDDARTKALIQK
jgi:hypothetical protein